MNSSTLRPRFLHRDLHFLNVHTGLFAIFEKLPYAFFPLYLYQIHAAYAGIAMPALFIYLLLNMYLMRIVFRFLSIPFLKRFGIKAGIVMSVAVQGLLMELLFVFPSTEPLLYLLGILFSGCAGIYWYSYHMYYTSLSNSTHRGKQFAVRQIFSIVMVAAFPVFSANFITHSGYKDYFMFALPLSLLAALSVWLCRSDVPLDAGKKPEWKFNKNLLKKSGIRMHPHFAWLDMLTLLWVVVLYGRGVEIITISWLMTIRIFVQSAWQFFIGHIIDHGYKPWLAWSGGLLVIAALCGQALLPVTLPVIVGLELLMAVGRTHFDTLVVVVLYNESHTQQRDHYWMLAEMAYDTGAISICIIMVVLMATGVDAKTLMLLALPSCMLIIRLLNRHAWSAAPVELPQPHYQI